MTTDLLDLKQAALDLAEAAGELFDLFDEHGFEAVWVGDGVFTVVSMQRAYETLRVFLASQAADRMLALGVSPETLAQITLKRPRFQ